MAVHGPVISTTKDKIRDTLIEMIADKKISHQDRLEAIRMLPTLEGINVVPVAQPSTTIGITPSDPFILRNPYTTWNSHDVVLCHT